VQDASTITSLKFVLKDKAEAVIIYQNNVLHHSRLYTKDIAVGVKWFNQVVVPACKRKGLEVAQL
jgi:hypothetical protein